MSEKLKLPSSPASAQCEEIDISGRLPNQHATFVMPMRTPAAKQLAENLFNMDNREKKEALSSLETIGSPSAAKYAQMIKQQFRTPKASRFKSKLVIKEHRRAVPVSNQPSTSPLSSRFWELISPKPNSSYQPLFEARKKSQGEPSLN